MIIISTSISPQTYTALPYNSTVTVELILQGSPSYNRDFEVKDWRTDTFSSLESRTFAELDGYSKFTAHYASFMCTNTGVHRAVLEQEDYSQLQYEPQDPLLIAGTNDKNVSPDQISVAWV